MSLVLEDLQKIVKEAGLTPEKQREIMQRAARLENENKQNAKEDAADGESKNKYRYVAYVRGNAALQKQLESGIYLVSVADAIANPENKHAKDIDVTQHLVTCAARQNEKLSKKVRGRKGREGMIVNWAQLFDWMKPKTLKENGGIMKVKTKLPVEIIVLTDEFVPFHGTDKQNMVTKTPLEQILEKTV